MINTTLKNKKLLFPIFVEGMKKELFEGAKKYKHGDKGHKEWTDVLMEFDDKFMLTTMMKYIGRINNGDPRAERDLRKIAVYAFLQWIKMYGGELIPTEYEKKVGKAWNTVENDIAKIIGKKRIK